MPNTTKNNVGENPSELEHKANISNDKMINAMTLGSDDKSSVKDNIVAMAIIKNEKPSEESNINPLILLNNNDQSKEDKIPPITSFDNKPTLSDNVKNEEVKNPVNNRLNKSINLPIKEMEKDNCQPNMQYKGFTPRLSAPVNTASTIQKLRRSVHNDYANFGETDTNETKCTPLDADEMLISQYKFAYIDNALHYFNGIYYERIDNNKAAEILLKLGYKSVKRNGHYNYLDDMERFMKIHPEIKKVDRKGSEERYLAFKNCVFDLETYNTYKNYGDFIVTSCIDCEYFAFQSMQSTPYWNMYLSYVTGGDKNLEKLIMEVLGYYITSDMSAQKFVILWGPGGTGKSVFGNFLRSLFNPEAVASISLQRLGDRFSLSSLIGKKLNIVMDLPGGKINNDSIAVLKQLTGNDLCLAEAKYKDPISFVNTCKLLFSTNVMISPETDDSGFRRRVLIIPFIYQVPDELKDPHLVDKLLKEKQLVVFNALNYYRELKNRNYKFTKINYEFYINSFNHINGISSEKYDMNDVVVEFLEQCCIFDLESKIHIRELYSAYKNYCAVKCKASFENQSEFTSALKKTINDRYIGKNIVFKKIRKENGNLSGVVGIALKQP